MARKSNKTAHVLNLLSGHDAAKDVDEQSSAEQTTSDDTTGQTARKAPGEASQTVSGGTTGQDISAGTDTSPGNTEQPAAAAPVNPPAPAPAVQNNIAVIDKTEDDPVAELIQQKLSSEFEKEIQQSPPDISVPVESEPASEAVSADVSADVSTPAPDAEAAAASIADQEQEVLPASAPDTSAAPVQEAVQTSQIAESQVSAQDPVSTQEANPGSQTATEQISAPESVPAQETVPAPQTATEQISAPESIPAQETAPAPQTTTEQISVQEPVPEPEPELDFAAVNVMEHIVNDKIIYFMRQFEVCTCSRCRADVTALTLNGLMPKYIVTMKTAVDPLLSYYTNRLISDVTVEATKACMIVKENPRH